MTGGQLRRALGGGGSSGPLPLPPTRDQILDVRCSDMQGLWVDTEEYGRIPYWGANLTALHLPTDRQRLYAAKIALGDTHCMICTSWKYDAAQLVRPIPGVDLQHDIPAVKALAREWLIARGNGAGIILQMAGDTESGDVVNQGAYGRQWLVANFAAGIHAPWTSGENFTPYTLYSPGFDGCWYGWDGPEAVREYWRTVRAVIGPTGYAAMYWSDKIQLGDGGATYVGDGEGIDLFFCESSYPMRSTQDGKNLLWENSGRLLGGAYRRPAEQGSFDPAPPFYLTMTPRGMQRACWLEFETYGHVRGWNTPADIQGDRDYLRSLGWASTG